MKKIMILLIGISILGGILFFFNEEKERNTKNNAINEETYYKNKISTKELKNSLSKKKDNVVYFYKDDCPYCKKVSPIILPMASEMNVEMSIVNLNEHSDGWDQFNLEGVPTIIYYKEGKEINRIEGQQSKEYYKKWFEKIVK